MKKNLREDVLAVRPKGFSRFQEEFDMKILECLQ